MLGLKKLLVACVSFSASGFFLSFVLWALYRGEKGGKDIDVVRLICNMLVVVVIVVGGAMHGRSGHIIRRSSSPFHHHATTGRTWPCEISLSAFLLDFCLLNKRLLAGYCYLFAGSISLFLLASSFMSFRPHPPTFLNCFAPSQETYRLPITCQIRPQQTRDLLL